jgi:saccharopine dehydrogenase-like NADP-dependent oxidoreductase
MSRVVILGGAGLMGRITARDLATMYDGSVEVLVADRELGPAKALGLPTAKVDVLDPKSLAKVLQGATVTIASLPYKFNLEAMHGALAAKTHYVDLGGLFHVTRKQLELKSAFADAGRLAVLGMGSAPGILNVMAAGAASELDEVHEIHCMVGAVDRTKWKNESPLGFGYSPDTLLDEFVKESAVFRDGKFQFVPAIDPGERIEVDFPAPVGKVKLDTTLHSEVATLPLSFAKKGCREVTFRQGFEEPFLSRLLFLVQLGLCDTTPLEGLNVEPRRVLAALLRRFPPAEPVGKPNKYELLRVLVTGTQKGKKVAITNDCHAGPDAGDGVGPDIDTGAPPGIVAQMLASGEIDAEPGVWAPEEVVPVGPFVRELERRGMKVTSKTERGGGKKKG